jgi:hypothetical protein
MEWAEPTLQQGGGPALPGEGANTDQDQLNVVLLGVDARACAFPDEHHSLHFQFL